MYLITWKNNLLFGEEKLGMEEAIIELAQVFKKMAEKFFEELKRVLIVKRKAKYGR